MIKQQLPDLLSERLVSQPSNKDTAAAIGHVAMKIQSIDESATTVFLPSDHLIPNVEAFQQDLILAHQVLNDYPNHIGTFGVYPTRATTEYGYLEIGDSIPSHSHAFKLQSFQEKPNSNIVQAFIKSGKYMWNRGIFVAQVAQITTEIAAHLPYLSQQLKAINATRSTIPNTEAYAAMPSISFDKGIMEHTNSAFVVEASFQREDIGSWAAIGACNSGRDSHGNVGIGKFLNVNSHHNVIYGSSDHLIVFIGIENLVVAQTPTATLVACQDNLTAIKDITALIKSKGHTEYL